MRREISESNGKKTIIIAVVITVIAMSKYTCEIKDKRVSIRVVIITCSTTHTNRVS